MTSGIINYHPDRNKWLTYNDAQLLKECCFTEFQSSGSGGQKRNRKYSSVRLAHTPSGLYVTAVKSRSQNDNKLIALKKLRRAIAMEVRSDSSPVLETYDISVNNRRYPSLLALLFDNLHIADYSVSKAGKKLHISTGQLVKLLARDKDAWQKVNAERKKRDMPLLKI